MTPIISIVVAVAENGVIGQGGDMPWRLSSDLKRFRAITLGKPIIMGRKTFDSIGKPLDGRDNIVVTRQKDFAPAGIHVVSNLDDALKLGGECAAKNNVAEIVVIGGGEIYAQALPKARRIHLTEVHAALDGDTHFPVLPATEWREVSRQAVPRGEKDSADTSYVILERL
ncbi:MAG: dihydrofolate reductase [Fimbriimonadaceae bacterium]|nr:dihydrofolate reductase [Alphaproteobacteria bacterium]